MKRRTKIIIGVGTPVILALGYYICKKNAKETFEDSSENDFIKEDKIVTTKDMVVPYISISERCRKLELNDSHYKQLKEYAMNFDENEAAVILNILVRKYPRLTCDVLCTSYIYMKDTINQISNLSYKE